LHGLCGKRSGVATVSWRWRRRSDRHLVGLRGFDQIGSIRRKDYRSTHVITRASERDPLTGNKFGSTSIVFQIFSEARNFKKRNIEARLFVRALASNGSKPYTVLHVMNLRRRQAHPLRPLKRTRFGLRIDLRDVFVLTGVVRSFSECQHYTASFSRMPRSTGMHPVECTITGLYSSLRQLQF
jgi:hypothetical protein